MNNFLMNKEKMNENNEILSLANKCLKQAKNKLYFNYKALSPALYRMSVEFVEPGVGMFGTDSSRIYADPMDVIMRYNKSPEVFMRTYLHMIFHCIYLHPFVTKYNIDTGLWNIALDICAEAAVLRLDPKSIDGDTERNQIINDIKKNIKMFIPDLVYRELSYNAKNYDLEKLIVLFHMDDHLWLSANNNNSSNSNDDEEDNDYQNPNKSPQPQSGNGNGNGEEDDDKKDSKNQNGNGNSDNKKESDNDQNGKGNGNNKSNGNENGNQNQPGGRSGGKSQEERKQEWSDVSRQIAADMQSFHSQGSGSGDMVQEIDYLTQDKMEYDEFLRQFSIIEEKMKVNLDEFDYMYYTYGLNGIQSSDGKKKLDKKVLLIEPLEYKEDKVIKEFVIAIDTSGSCSGDLVKKFINKTYSILKETENFSSRVNIHIVQCDTRIQHDTKITTMEEMDMFLKNMKLYGFGGTDFRPVFEYVDSLIAKKEFTNLCGLIYFTDGYGTYPTKPTPYKTAFAFMEDYSCRDDVPAWAMSVYWNDEETIIS